MNNIRRRAVCVITRKPNLAWFDFLSEFKHYDTYVAIDDNSENYADEYKLRYPSIKLIQIEDLECENNGFINLNHILSNKKATGWEKALLYFAKMNQVYDNIWFFEDDVFFFNEKTLSDIDNRYLDSDLLSAPYEVSTKTAKNWFWWPKINIELPPPYYKAMVCSVRVSNRLLLKIGEYAARHHTLFFLEVLFPTLALKNQLRYDLPREMRQIYFRYQWNVFILSKRNIFHPVKNIDMHAKARRILTKIGPIVTLTFGVVNFFTQLYINTKLMVKRVVRK